MKRVKKRLFRGGAAVYDGRPPPPPPLDHHLLAGNPSEKKGRDRREKRAFVGKKEKREKDNGKMRDFFSHSLYIAAHDPTQKPTNRPGSLPLSPTPPLFCFCTPPNY